MPRLLKLDRMEIIGFKSFYGRTRFEFPEGITAVVGPNGCGKSNIGDAISWVLGEQKASSLRSDRMEDVIFNGSEAKRPLGMAEVSLHFKNIGLVADSRAPVSSSGNGHGSAPSATLAIAAADAGADLPVPIALASEVSLVDEAPMSEGGPDLEGAPAGEAVESPRFLVEEIPESVVVTRRLYRSGESEYILNGQRCRLKDIQDLLARTQIGTRLYTTIEQGKIDQILTSKPKDRRAIIEEAAGILGYKAKRRQAEHKLEATQANLLRLSDITSEVEKQIHSLKRQAAKARRYRRLAESLRERRVSIAARRLRTLDEDRRVSLELLAVLHDQEAVATADLARAEAEREALRLQLEEGEQASRLRREEIHALDMEIDRLQSRRRATEEQAGDLDQRIAGAAREGQELGGRAAEHQGRSADLRLKADVEVEILASAEAALARVEAERVERAAVIEERERLLVEARSELLRHLDLLTSTARARAALQEQIRSTEESRARVEIETAESRATLERLRAEGSDLEIRAGAARARREELEIDRARRSAEEHVAHEAVLDAERRAEELKGRAAALHERLATLGETERQHAGYAEGVGEIMGGAAGFAPRGLVGDAIEVPRGLERAVAATLDGLLEGVLVPGHEEARHGVAHLRRRGSGRVSFVPAAPMPDAQGALAGMAPPHDLLNRAGVLGPLVRMVGTLPDGGPVARVLANTLLVADLNVAVELAAAYPGWSYVTAEGDVVRADGVVIGGEGGTLAHGVLARRAERDAIADQIAASSAERAGVEEAIGVGRAALATITAGAQATTSELQEADKAALEVELRLMQKRGEMQRIETSLPLLSAELDRLRAAIAARRAEADDRAAQATAAEERRRELEGSIRGASHELAAGRAEIETVQRLSGEARAAVAAGQERRSFLARERQALEEAIAEIQARTERGAVEGQEWAARVVSLKEEGVSLAAAITSALERRAAAAERDEAAAAGLAYDRSLLHAREQAAKEGRTGHDALRRELQEAELHLARLDSDLRHLGTICHVDLGTTLEMLRAAPQPAGAEERSVAEDETEIETLKADLEGIGPVNLMAIEQYTELEERFTFLMAQKTDLESSINSLRETIRKINRESRARFLAAFEAIQKGFAESFTTLFGGGRAELRLEEGEEDVLETGIEIAAQPPGKRLQSIALLSGGEKALTAVALLFAMFRYRPSPFCVLDEVDAPLDEANVERFTRLLQGLREETQFIVITHNRKSMEVADLLYGVTMEEPGVSKVLPLRFE